MVQIKLSVVFILAAAAIAPIVALPAKTKKAQGGKYVGKMALAADNADASSSSSENNSNAGDHRDQRSKAPSPSEPPSGPRRSQRIENQKKKQEYVAFFLKK